MSAPEVIAQALADTPPLDRAKLLHELIKHAAEGLLIIEGQRRTYETLFDLADSIMLRP